MANNNYDRMHRGETQQPVSIPNKATKKRRAKQRKRQRAWLIALLVTSLVIFAALVGIFGSLVQSVFLGIFGWMGVLLCVVGVLLCSLALTGVLRRKRKWTKAHRALLVGVGVLWFILTLLLHLAIDRWYNATLNDVGTVTYGSYLEAVFFHGNTTVGGVFMGWIAYPFLNVIGQKISCIVLVVLFSAILLALIWPFWQVTRSRVVGDDKTSPETFVDAADALADSQEAQPTMFVDTVDGDKPSRARRKAKREIFDIAYPNKEQPDEEEEEAIDRIDENDPTYKRLMREEADPDKRKLMAKELLLDMTDEQAKRYLSTPEYDPAADSDSPLRYGRRDSTHAQFGGNTPESGPTTGDNGFEATWSAQRAANRPQEERDDERLTASGETSRERQQSKAFDILFGEEPVARSDNARLTGQELLFGRTDASAQNTPATDAPIGRTDAPVQNVRPNVATPKQTHAVPNTGNNTPTGRQIPVREEGPYVVTPRRTLDDLPRRQRPAVNDTAASNTAAQQSTPPARTTEQPIQPTRQPTERAKPVTGQTPNGTMSMLTASDDTTADAGRTSPLTPADADRMKPKQYPAFADESPLDRALQTLDAQEEEQQPAAKQATPVVRDTASPRREQRLNEEQEADYDEEAEVYEDEEVAEAYEEETEEEEDYDSGFDPEAQRTGYVEREEQEFPSAFDGFVARPNQESESTEEEEDEEEDVKKEENNAEQTTEDVKPRFLAVPDDKTQKQARACQPKREPPKKIRPYTAPSLYLLRDFPPPVDMEDYEAMYHNIEDAFAAYGITVRVLGHTRGPTYTQYAVQLADGVRFQKVSSLEQDIVRKMRLSEEINMVAKVPNMDAIGVEVVNRTRSTVGLKPLLTSSVFRQDKKLYFALGVDVMGRPYYCDILSGPHMLIAGSSGSGKSVCLNTLICCLLFNYKPDYVKFILIDPKGGVEMDVYNDLPHNLLGQAATNPSSTLKALDWAIEEMERRYALMRTVNIRSLGDYNDKMVQAGLPRLPYILVIIDELADLMKLNKKMANDMETRISRLTAKARACGIHVIVATQRPSVDVITGTIKNNIPTRVAFRTATQIDSKTILERGCAEKLYGKGDLFLMANGANELRRLQCPFLSDDEVFSICEEIRANNDAVVDPSITARVFKEDAVDDAQVEEDFGMGNMAEGNEGDSLFERATRFVARQGNVSISRLQREFRIGFARAGYLVDEMEKRGFVSPADPNGSNRPRAVLITPADCDEIFGHSGEDDE